MHLSRATCYVLTCHVRLVTCDVQRAARADVLHVRRADLVGAERCESMTKVNRREFVLTSTAAGLAAAAPRTAAQSPTVITPGGVKPVVVSSANGHRYKNGGTRTCVETAFTMMTEGKAVLE